MENIALCAVVTYVTTLQLTCNLNANIPDVSIVRKSSGAARKLAGPKLGQAGSTGTRRHGRGAAPPRPHAL